MQDSFFYEKQGQGLDFIFQHGLGAKRAQPQGLLADLEGVQLISMDCPGHGEAPLPEGLAPSFNYYTERIKGLMDHLEIKRAIFGGISMGAGISTNMALRYPERVAALVLVRPAWLDMGNPDNLLILQEAARFIGQSGGRAQFEQRPDFQAVHQHLPKAALSIVGVFDPTQRKEIPLVLQSMIADRPFESMLDLETIDIPVLIIANEEDPLHPNAMAEQMHQRIRQSRLVKVVSRYIDDNGHREAVQKTVTKFIKEL